MNRRTPEGKFGFCPKCGENWLKKDGFTSNRTCKKQRYKCRSCSFITTEPNSPQNPIPMKSTLPRVKRYFITSAQNATPIHEALWNSIGNFVKENEATLVVIPGRYKNPTSLWTEGNNDHEWWAEEVLEYLIKGEISLGERITLLGDVKIQWAAMNPLTSLDTLTGENSGIVGHPKRALKSIATPQHKQPKMMFTTGCCTIPNYTDTKQGKIAKFHHCYGGLVVEIVGDKYFVRQINALKNGTFIDLGKEYTPEGVKDAKRPLSLAMGDTHWIHRSEDVDRATFGKDGIVETLKPHYLVWHDVLDFYSRNHHHKGRWTTELKKHLRGVDNVEMEVQGTLDYVRDNTPEDTLSVVVSSNHDRALERWLLEGDFKKDPLNMDFYLRCSIGIVREIKENGEWTDPFIKYGEEYLNPLDRVKFLRSNESFMLGGVEHGLHGDIGPSGSRGSTKNLSRIGVKVTKGHSHQAEIIEGCYSVGKGTNRLEYESGPSASSNTHCIQYANSKRSLITIIKGGWKL